MRLRTVFLAITTLAPAVLTGCTSYAYGPPPPPPAGWLGESWGRHVMRCERRFPNYDPRTDTINQPSGSFRCPL